MIALPTFRGVLSGFSPLSLAPALWLDAESLSGSDGTQISTWSDRSGNSRDATQATSASQPKLYNSVLNGKKVVRFDGSDDLMLCDFGATISQPVTVIWSGKYSSLSPIVNGRIFYASTSSTAEVDLFIAHAVAQNGNLFSNFGTQATWGAGTTVNAVYSATANGASSTLHRSGTLLNTLNAGTNGCGRYVSIGGRYHDGLRCVAADIAEILVFPTALSTTNRQRVERYLGAKYAITIP